MSAPGSSPPSTSTEGTRRSPPGRWASRAARCSTGWTRTPSRGRAKASESGTVLSTTLEEALQRLATGQLLQAEGAPLRAVTRVPIGGDELHVTSGLFPESGYEIG